MNPRLNNLRRADRRPETLEKYLTRQDAAELLNVSTDTVRRLIARGELKAYKVGRAIRIDPADLRRVCKPIRTSAPMAGR